MKKILALLLCLLTSKVVASNQITIYYLTANEYCPSVEMIEKETKNIIDSLYSKEKTDGIIEEKTLNILLPENKDFTSKWEIYTNGLIFLVTKDSQISKVDLNDFAFTNVPGNIPNFKEGLIKQINQILKK